MDLDESLHLTYTCFVHTVKFKYLPHIKSAQKQIFMSDGKIQQHQPMRNNNSAVHVAFQQKYKYYANTSISSSKKAMPPPQPPTQLYEKNEHN